MLNKLTFTMALLALAISLIRQPLIPTAAAQLTGTSITNWAGSPGNTCGAGKAYLPGSIGIEADNGHIWTCVGSAWFDDSAAGAGVPSRLTVMVTSGSCPSGYTQVTALNGAMPEGTLAANGDVGGTGGANSITPTVATLTAAAQTFTGTPFTSVINHTHTVTVTYNAQGGTTASTSGTHSMTSTATGGSARALTTGDVVSATTANPSGGVTSITPAGTNGTSVVTGTLNSFDNRPAYVKVIYCQKS